MQVHVDVSSLKQTRWNQLVIRFCIGGLITAGAGVIAARYGPEIGGLFLAFPAIFPAGATLLEKHEKERKRKAGLNGTGRARQVASIDAIRAAMGAVGLPVFALVESHYLQTHEAPVVLLLATVSWIAVSFFAWCIRKRKFGLRADRAKRFRITEGLFDAVKRYR